MRFDPPAYGRAASTALLLASAALLAGCQSLQSSDSFMGVITPYKVEIVQGNVITKEQAALAKPGMTRSQVRDVLGSPLLADVFHGDRWDYVFTIRRPGAAPQQRKVIARFDGDVLKDLDTGGELPGEHDFVASIDTFKTSRNAPPLVLSDEQIKALPVPPATPPYQVEPSGPARAYPPLEPTT
ncbi:MAG TPA: outer membrane protein assembly factor BamE [Burkholderiaceae bacterium]